MAFKAILEIEGQEFDILSYQNNLFYPNPRDMMFYFKNDIFEEIKDPIALFGSMHKYHCWEHRLLDGFDRPESDGPVYRPTANLLGGLFTFTIESAGREDIFEDSISSRKDFQTPMFNGQIKFMGREEKDLPIQRIEFWDGYVCDLKESFCSTGTQPMTMEVTISPATIKVNDMLIFQRNWHVTSAENQSVQGQTMSKVMPSNVAPVGITSNVASSVAKTSSKSIGKSLGKTLEKKAGGILNKLGDTLVKKVQEEGFVEKLVEKVGEKVKVAMEEKPKNPRVTKMYWMDEKEKKKISTIGAGQTAILYIQTKDFDPGSKLSIPLQDPKTKKVIETLEAEIGTDGWGRIIWTNESEKQ